MKAFVYGVFAGAAIATGVHYLRAKLRRKRTKLSFAHRHEAAVVTAGGSARPQATDDQEGQEGERKKSAQRTVSEHFVQPPKLAECYLLLHHVSKRRNVGSVLRSAAALGCTAVIVVGMRKASQLNFFGSFGTERRMKIYCFLYLDEAIQFLRNTAKNQGRAGCTIYGIEITPDAVPLHGANTFAEHRCAEEDASSSSSSVLPNNACFIPGNEGHGLTAQDRQHCDRYVVIPQYATSTASLNVSSAVAIVLSQFAVKAGFIEAPREGEKFLVSSVEAAQAVVREQVSANRSVLEATAREYAERRQQMEHSGERCGAENAEVDYAEDESEAALFSAEKEDGEGRSPPPTSAALLCY